MAKRNVISDEINGNSDAFMDAWRSFGSNPIQQSLILVPYYEKPQNYDGPNSSC